MRSLGRTRLTTGNILQSGESFNAGVPNDFGDGSDGVFAGGALARGTQYQFSKIDLTSAITFTGTGGLVVKCRGDFKQNGKTITLRQGENLSAGNVTFRGITRGLSALSQTAATGGRGGVGTSDGATYGGTGGAGGNSDTNGNDGGTAKYGTAAVGDGGTAPGGDGGDGATSSPDGNLYASGGGGGAGGANGDSCENVAFAVGGKIILTGTISGSGETGGDGGDGGDGLPLNATTLYTYGGGSGGGGAGGSGGHAGNIYFFTFTGDVTNTATITLSGGGGGDGATSGTCGGTAKGSATPAHDGSDGNYGIKGNDGKVEFIKV